MALDPATGLPIGPEQTIPEPQWIDPKWSDPDIVLSNVDYRLPLREVASQLHERFKDYFDILPMPQTYGVDWGSTTTIELQLRNVRASDIFNAMNMVFENDHTPLRWQLLNTPRPTVILRVLPEADPRLQAKQSRPQIHRTVCYVGNLIGDDKAGGMTMDEVIKTLWELWPKDFGKPEDVIQFHADAQLIVVNGTEEQDEFVHQVLSALEQKVAAARPKSADEKDVENLVNMIKNLKGLSGESK